jgi:FAD/FMN-containing dehydrogenase
MRTARERAGPLEEWNFMTDVFARAVHRLDEHVRGRVSGPGEQRYEKATALWARPAGSLPRAVVHCETAHDVQETIRIARDAGLVLSVRGGGHDWAGRALCEGIVIDLSGMYDVAIDVADRRATSSGGARASDILAVTDLLGLAAVTGSVGAVGMTGLTLGGGYGPLIGQYGLALDNLLGAEVVLADGRIVRADRDSEPDLFWALRGGGGNFGVVTSMQQRLHVLPIVRSGMILFPASEAKAVLEGCAEIATTAPDTLTFQIMFIFDPDKQPMIAVIPTWCGSSSEGEARLAPFLALGNHVASFVAEQPLGASLKMFDPHIVNGLRVTMETCWLPALNRGAIDAFLHAMQTAMAPGCAIVTHEFKGAASRIPLHETAFGLRRDHVLVEILAAHASDDLVEGDRYRQWVKSAHDAFDVLALPGGYPNMLKLGDTKRASQSFGSNAARLIEIKRRYDPDNVFSSAIPLPTE